METKPPLFGLSKTGSGSTLGSEPLKYENVMVLLVDGPYDGVQVVMKEGRKHFGLRGPTGTIYTYTREEESSVPPMRTAVLTGVH